jgi:hypothetical protein
MHRGERSGQTKGSKTLTFNARSFLAQSFDKLDSAPLPLACQVVRQLTDLAKCDGVCESFWLHTRTQKSHVEVDVLPRRSLGLFGEQARPAYLQGHAILAV